jgi:hypothetical protein
MQRFPTYGTVIFFSPQGGIQKTIKLLNKTYNPQYEIDERAAEEAQQNKNNTNSVKP